MIGRETKLFRDISYIRDFAKKKFADEQADYSHSFEHTMRVYRLAEVLCKHEGGNLDVILAAALLHDVARYKEELGECEDHALEGAKIAGRLLKRLRWPLPKIEAVKHAIETHSHSAKLNKDYRPQSFDAKILMDADKLDSLGAVAIVRAVASSLQTRKYARPVFTKEVGLGSNDFNVSAIHFLWSQSKKARLSSYFHTKTAKKLAKGRIAIMDKFIKDFINEF